jgi:uncharacterized protein (TIGR02594 family)
MTNSEKLALALFQLGGVAEIEGSRSNPLLLSIMKKHLVSTTDDSTTAWCGIIMGEIFDRCGLPKPPGYTAARSWIKQGTEIKIEEAKPGDVVIFTRPPSTWQGHVALYVWHNDTHVMVCGGNQSNKVCFQSYVRERVLGIRRP